MKLSVIDARCDASMDANSNASAELRLAELVEELRTKLQAGAPVELEKLAAAHPDQAQELRRLLPALRLMGDVSRSGLAVASTPAGLEAEALLGELGDFRLIREVGRGGMGVVYEAEQLSLHRRVAVK